MSALRRGFARAITRVASRVVPSGRRDEWRAEWEGELAERERRGGDATWFAVGSIPHAFAELRQDWNADVLLHELRHAVRTQRRSPGYTITAALLIALGVGANTTVFTLINSVLLRPPRGVTRPDQLVQIGRVNPNAANQGSFDSWSYPLFAQFRARNTSFSDLVAYENRDALIGEGAATAQARAQLVSANFFSVLGASLQRGRGILDADLARDAEPVVVLSEALWQTRFGGDPGIVGKSIRVRGTPFRVIGITAPDFFGLEVVEARPDLWVPLTTSSLISPGSGVAFDSPRLSWLWVIGRLKPGVDVGPARDELSALFRAIQLDVDGEIRNDVALQAGLGMHPDERALAVRISSVLFGMVVLVLVVTCANLAALLLARGTAREGEIGVRLAVGAARGRVVRQLLLETTLLATLGSLLAFVATRWTARFVEWLMPYDLAVTIAPDGRVLVFGILIGVSTAVAFAIVPALRSTRVDLLALLRSGAGGAGSAGIDRGRLRSVLLVAQIALSFVLLTAAGLLARTVQRAATSNPGFRTDRVLVGEVDARLGVNETAEIRMRRLESIVERARQMPGVEGATLASAIPTATGLSIRSMWRPGQVIEGLPPAVTYMVVDTAYFHTMDVSLVAGRAFDATLDAPGVPSSVVINEALAKLLWPGESAIGKRVAFGSIAGERTVTVIGVARNARNRSLRAPPAPQAYGLLSQNPTGSALLHVRVAPGQTTLAPTLSAELLKMMPGAAPIRFESIRSWMARGYADVRLIQALGAAFGLLALIVASAGIYGVVSYETERRRREYGVRLALGARPLQVHAMVLRRSARLTGLGIAIGFLAFLGSAPLLGQWVFGVPRVDPLTLTAITAVLLLSAAAAAAGPALRASRADPINSLRAE